MENFAPNPWLNRFALLAALGTLAVIVTGAQVTSQRPTAVFSVLPHRGVADPVGLLVLILAGWAVFKSGQALVKQLALAAFVIVVIEILLGRMATPSSSFIGFFHSILGHLLFVTTAAIATLTSESLAQEPLRIVDRGWPPLRSYAALTACLVGVQVILGAAFRHDLLGVLWHIIGALLLALFLIGLGMLVLNHPPKIERGGVQCDNCLRLPAITVMVTAALQLGLGMTLISLSDAAMRAPSGVAITITHTANGALTLSLTVVIAILARRHMEEKPRTAVAAS